MQAQETFPLRSYNQGQSDSISLPAFDPAEETQMLSRDQSLSARYARAEMYTAPKLAASTPGVSVEGYWLTSTKYFFISERIHPTFRRIVSIPCIADPEA